MSARSTVGYIMIAVVIVVVVYFIATSNLFPKTTTTTTSPTASTSASTTSILTTINYSKYVYPCNTNYALYANTSNSTIIGRCSWTGGLLGLWIASGSAAFERVSIRGADNKTYVNQTSKYNCLTFYQNFSAPAQTYTVTLRTFGVGSGGSCNYGIALLNTTTTPPQTVYQNVYNGDFSNGKYTGWNTTNPGFGPAPLNITYANNALIQCYLAQPWTGYVGTYFATTFNCGLTNSPGNITSSSFYVNPTVPFLNFKIISQDDSRIYVMILQNNTPKIIVHYNTFNNSLGGNASSIFRNASIPLTLLGGKIVRIRVVAASLNVHRYIAIGDFALASRPVQTIGIVTNTTFVNS